MKWLVTCYGAAGWTHAIVESPTAIEAENRFLKEHIYAVANAVPVEVVAQWLRSPADFAILGDLGKPR